ncbi:type II toxin-antitoxin system PemK/MazF family toxin [Kribbella sp. NPDC058245]|uniref:type II toxin-antitoxin system PemK/MazF family toxin n=1 Tax=Kribbella sp. NPDC058245 TaxID=3346399 RepID=UPI0036E73E61
MADQVAERPEYPGDFEGTVHVEYKPHPDDGVADPGEVVWTWVPFEEDHHRGKDRPVLVVGSDEQYLLALILTSKDHDRDAADEARWGRVWMDVGKGDWDREGRNSEVRLDRVLRIEPALVRREGAVISEDLFNQVAAELHTLHRS